MAVAKQAEDLTSEPLVHELLDDPITQMLMRFDGVERAALDPLLQDIMDKVSASEVA